jgi:hypothetical protein
LPMTKFLTSMSLAILFLRALLLLRRSSIIMSSRSCR